MFDEDTIWNVNLPSLQYGWIMTSYIHNSEGAWVTLELSSSRDIKLTVPFELLGSGRKTIQN